MKFTLLILSALLLLLQREDVVGNNALQLRRVGALDLADDDLVLQTVADPRVLDTRHPNGTRHRIARVQQSARKAKAHSAQWTDDDCYDTHDTHAHTHLEYNEEGLAAVRERQRRLLRGSEDLFTHLHDVHKRHTNRSALPQRRKAGDPGATHREELAPRLTLWVVKVDAVCAARERDGHSVRDAPQRQHQPHWRTHRMSAEPHHTAHTTACGCRPLHSKAHVTPMPLVQPSRSRRAHATPSTAISHTPCRQRDEKKQHQQRRHTARH